MRNGRCVGQEGLGVQSYGVFFKPSVLYEYACFECVQNDAQAFVLLLMLNSTAGVKQRWYKA